VRHEMALLASSRRAIADVVTLCRCTASLHGQTGLYLAIFCGPHRNIHHISTVWHATESACIL
jgi:hypothetical protein